MVVSKQGKTRTVFQRLYLLTPSVPMFDNWKDGDETQRRRGYNLMRKKKIKMSRSAAANLVRRQRQ